MRTIYDNQAHRRYHIFIVGAMLVGMMIWSLPSSAQNDDMSYVEIEKAQDEIENLYVEVYGIMDQYPDAKYRYVYSDGDVTEVVIEGIPNNRDKKQLEVYLIDLEGLKDEIANVANRVGVYYVTETEPRPKIGYDAFYDKLMKSIDYPLEAREEEVEGVVYVKFLVDAVGEIDHLQTTETLQSPSRSLVDSMTKEAMRAVKATSGGWIPAQVGNVAVAQWMILPVQFKLKGRYFNPLF